MKQLLKYIITTIIMIGVVASSLLFPSAAEYESFNFDKLTTATRHYNGTNTAITPVPVLSSEPLKDSILISTQNTISGVSYSQYINFQYRETVTGVPERQLPYFQFYVIPTVFNNKTNKSSINYFEFNYTCVVGSDVTGSPLPFTPLLFWVNSELFSQYSIVYNVSMPISGTVNNGAYDTEWFYRTVNCKILVDDGFEFEDDDTIAFTLRSRSVYVETPTEVPAPALVSYSIGLSALQVGYKTVDDYIADISSSLDNIDTALAGISNSLSQDLTLEQQKVLDDLTDKIEDYHSNEDFINNSVSGYIDTYNSNPITFENSDFDIVLQNNYNNVFSDDGFLGFWNILWYNPFVIAAMALVLVFATASYIIYGLR